MAKSVPPYKITLISGKDSPPGTQMTPQLYIHHFIQGQKSVTCFGFLQILLPLLCYCATQEAGNFLAMKNINMLGDRLGCIQCLNITMLILNVISIISIIFTSANIFILNYYYVTGSEGNYGLTLGLCAIVFLVFTYSFIFSMLLGSQISSYKVVRDCIPLLNGVGSMQVPPNFNDGGMSVGGNYAPAPVQYQAPPQGQPAHQPNNQGF